MTKEELGRRILVQTAEIARLNEADELLQVFSLGIHQAVSSGERLLNKFNADHFIWKPNSSRLFAERNRIEEIVRFFNELDKAS